MSRPDSNTGEIVKERVQIDKKEPELYKVFLINDDYSTMEFVIHVLEKVFQKSPAEAYRIMMHVHVDGRGVCGVYPFDVAETRVAATDDLAQSAGYPLKAVMERE